MKILKGSLVETRFAWPTVDQNKGENRPLQPISEKTYKENQVTYMSDKLGLHRIKNPDANDYAVSLHCKSPFAHVHVSRQTLMIDSVYASQRSGLWVQYFR